MIKFLMALITAFTSFIGLLGINNSALATPVPTQEIQPVVFDSVGQTVNLNLTASLWQLDSQNTKNIFDHLGCACAACSQPVETENSL